MKWRIRCFLSPILILLAACTAGPSPDSATDEPTSTDTPTPTATIEATATPSGQSAEAVEAWRSDLEQLAREMPNIHPNLYWRSSREEFEAAFAAMDAQLPDLTDEQIYVELMRIVALVDGHSMYSMYSDPVSFQLYPIQPYQFADGLFIVQAGEGLQDAIGGRLISVGGYDIDEVFEMMLPLSPHDNEMSARDVASMRLVTADILHALGIIEDVSQPNFVVELADGTQQTINPPLITFGEYEEMTGDLYSLLPTGLPKRDDVLYLSRRDEVIWFTMLDDDETLYIQYNQVRPGSDRAADEIAAYLEDHEVSRVIVDMRHNGGGNNGSYGDFLDLLSTHPAINQPGKLYVIIGRETFSAAVNFATELEGLTDAIFVGETTGGNPNLYGDTLALRLNRSGIVVRVSSIYWEKSTPDDDRMGIAPDIPVDLASEDFFAGHDPALEPILSADR